MSYESSKKYIGIGVVCAPKNDNSGNIMVYPAEHLPFFEADITSDITDIVRTGVDASGNKYSVTLHMVAGVKALWMKDGNRVNAPPVAKGEQVDLFQISDTDQYYWKELGRDNELRRQDVASYAWSATDTSNSIDKAVTADNSYTAEVNGADGHITVSTSKANNEKASYTFQLNGKDGHATLTDGYNNVQIDSTTNTVSITNGNGSYIVLVGTVINENCKTSNTTATDQYNVNSKAITLNGSDTVHIKASNITFDGNVTFNNPVTMQNGLSVAGGSTSFSGNVTGSTASFSGNVTAPNIH